MEFAFGDHVLDVYRRELRRGRELIALEPQVFDLLVYLMQHRDRVVSKEDLLEAIWGGRIVSESTLTSRITAVRKAIGDSGEAQRLIRTVPRKGFRFVGAVQEETAETAIDPQKLITGIVPRPGRVPHLSIVVLPFANLSNDPEQEYFADGITDDLCTDLSRISGAFVIARSTAFASKGERADVRQIGRELGVRYVLEGSVRRIGDRVRINAQLIDVETGAHLWADRVDADRANGIEVQDAITGRLARTLHLELVKAAGRRIEQEETVDPDARDLVMRGWAWWHRPISPVSRQEAQRAFERALEIDPQSAEARTGIATVLVANIPAGFSNSFQQDVARAERLLLEAIERDPNVSMAHLAMGQLRRLQSRLPEALFAFETAIALDRNNARAISQLGQTLMFQGQPDLAIPHIEKAIRLNPREAHLHYWGLGECHLLLGHVDQAIDLLRQARAANPRIYYIHLELAAAFGLRDDLDEARASLAETSRLQPDIDSLAALRIRLPWLANPGYWGLREKTANVGLRRAGFPDE